MGNKPDYAALAQDAHNAVKSLDATEEYKLAGYKIILTALVGGRPSAQPSGAPATDPVAQKLAKRPVVTDDTDWAGQIADAYGMSAGKITDIYYYDGENLKLLIGRKQLPESASLGTQHIAALLAGGRQALGLDADGTEFELLKPALKTHNVFNLKNWTTYIKLLGSKFIFEGSGKQQTVKLTNKAFDVVADIAKSYVEEA